MCRRWSIKSALSLLLILIALWGSGRVTAAEIPAKSSAPEPVAITSNKMTIKNQENKIIFEGNVLIKKGDLTIHSDRAEVFLAEPPGGGSSKNPSLFENPTAKGGKDISRIETTGNVDIVQGEKHAKAQKGVYDQKKDTIILTGEPNPEAWENDYRVKGKMITLYITENRSVVEGGSQVVIQSGAKNLNLGTK